MVMPKKKKQKKKKKTIDGVHGNTTSTRGLDCDK
jgi:hypothetical protein